MVFSDWRYIGQDFLPNLRKYSYHGIDRSLIANHIMQPYWRWVVEFLPLTMA